MSEISVIVHDPVPHDIEPITADEMKENLEALGYHVKAVLVRQDYAPPYWLLHRECNHHVGPFSTRLDAITAREVAIAPEVFEILGDDEFKEYLDVRAECRANLA